MDPEHFRRLERMYHAAPINRWYAPRLTVDAGRARLVIPLRAEFHHALHAVHGSVVFKALDDAAFFAANSLVSDAFVLTASFNLHLLKPVSEGSLHSEGVVVHRGSAFLAEAVARDDAGNEVARGSGTFVRSRLPLRPEDGYR